MNFEQQGKGLGIKAAVSHVAAMTWQPHGTQSQPQWCVLLGTISATKTRPPMQTVAFLLIRIYL